jgi:hypothetical protein
MGSWSPDSSTTGGAQTGFTDPTYTLVADSAPDVNGKQHAVSALGGTQAGVRTNTISDPFTVTFTKPKNPRTLGNANPVTGKYGNVPKNTYNIIVRKGVNVASGMAPQLMLVRVSIEVPAGADSYDAANVRAALSLLVGVLSEESADMGDSVVTGVL